MSTNIHGKSHPIARSLRLCSKGNGGIYGKTAQAKKRREYTIRKPLHKYPVMWKHIFMTNKQVTQLGCSAGSIASYVTGAAAQRGGLEIAVGMYVFIWLGAYTDHDPPKT